MTKKYRLFFIDPVTLTLADTNNGVGYELTLPGIELTLPPSHLAFTLP